MSRTVLVWLFVACLAVFVVGCQSRPAAGIYNNSGRIVIGGVDQDGTAVVHRSLLAPGAWKVNSPWPQSVGETATVSWQEGNGERFDREVAVRDVVPGSFNGTVWFKIEPDRSVEVVPVSKGAANRGEDGPDKWKRGRGGER